MTDPTKEDEGFKFNVVGFLDKHTAQPDANGSMFAPGAMKKAVANYQAKIDAGAAFGYTFYPKDVILDERTQVSRISHKVTALRVEDDGTLVGTSEILDTKEGRKLQDQLAGFRKLDRNVSMRATSSWMGEAKGKILEPESLMQVDIGFEAAIPAEPARVAPTRRLTGLQARQQILVISGPSGSGKSTLERQLHKFGWAAKTISHTTRAPREGEVDGEAYYFVSKEEFDLRWSAGEFVETAVYHGCDYGMSHEELLRASNEGRNPVILVVNTEGLERLRQTWPGLWSVWLDVPSPIRMRERMVARGDTEEAAGKRLSTLQAERAEAERIGYEFRVHNNEGEFQVCVEAFRYIIMALGLRR